MYGSTGDRLPDRSAERRRMVERQIVARGVSDEAVLAALAEVPRELFVPPEQAVHAYADAPLPIGENQTIAQPYVVALMADLAELHPGARVLEVGTGSGYAAAVLSRAAGEVFTVERHASLAAEATQRLRDIGYNNIHVAVRDGTLGWPEHAPYDAIIVAAGGPERAPQALLDQLSPGGRLVIPRGETQSDQELIRIRHTPDGRFAEERFGPVRFVPLIGEAGWRPDEEPGSQPSQGSPCRHARPAVPGRMAAEAEAFDEVASADLRGLIQRIGHARLVLIGEASHGTSEFYRMRARITQELIAHHRFDFVAVEADWPDAAEIDAYVRHVPDRRPHFKPFQRFPRWMWANTDVLDFVHWLRAFNEGRAGGPDRRVGFHGLDLYSMHTSIESVLRYLDDVDADAAAVARHRYGCLAPWQDDPVLYGRAVLSGTFDRCEEEVLAMLNDLLHKRLEYSRRDGARFADAVQNARLVVNAEHYYRVMYRGSVASWNLRDQHMFDTLTTLLTLYGTGSRGVVWAHNSHLGDASATDMGARGEHNIGQLARQAHADSAYLIGFGTHTGTVAAASDWGDTVQVMTVQPSHPRSYERLCHDTGVPRFMLPLRPGAVVDRSRDAHHGAGHGATVRDALLEPRLERAIGVIYRPDTELQSHYFHASLPRQFDEWIWFDESSAVTEIGDAHRPAAEGMPDTFPFGL